MILLTATTDKLEVITGSAGDVDVHVSHVDHSSGTITPGKTNTNITTATTTDISGSPAASTQRNVKNINIRNVHASNSNTITVQFDANGTEYELFKCVLSSNEVLTYVEGIGWDIYASDGSHKAASGKMLFKCLTADATGQNVNTAQPWFPTAGAVTIQANTTYFFEGLLQVTSGTTSHSLGVHFGGTGTVQDIMWFGTGGAVAAAATINALSGGVFTDAGTNRVLCSAAAAAEAKAFVCGTVRFTTAGTFIPNYQFSAAPGTTVLTKRDTYFRMWPVGDNNVASIGTWA